MLYSLNFHFSARCRSDNDQIIAQATANNVKMYHQASTAADVIMNLKTTDRIVFIRKHNPQWAIVTVGDKVGYVLFSELTNPPAQVIAMQRRRK